MSNFSSWLFNYLQGVFVESWVFFLVFLIVFTVVFIRYPTIQKKSPLFWGWISVLWIFLIQGDSFLLGPFSRMEWGDGAPSYIGDLSLRAVKVSGVYLHEVLGGVDSYSIYREGPEYFSIRIILRQLLPLWVGVAIIRVVVTAIAFFGIYCWTRLHYRLGYSIREKSLHQMSLFRVPDEVGQ